MKKVDVHTHYGEMPCVGEANSLKKLRAMLKQWDIRACLCSSARSVFHDMKAGNRELARVLEQAPEIFGYIYFDPRIVKASIAEIERYGARPKFIGVKSRPDFHGQMINSGQCREILACAKAHALPLLLHTYGTTMARAAREVAEEFALPIILAHMGGPSWKETVDTVVECPNLFVEPCCTYKSPGKVDYAVSRLGREQVLFGSDLTLLHPAWSVGMVEGSALEKATKEFIYWRNAVRLFPQVGEYL